MGDVPYKLVMVEWVDSRGANSEWEWHTKRVKRSICECVSAGWLVEETEEFVCIASHIGIDDPCQSCGDMIIPKVAVKKITELEVKNAGA